jgi:hypothetical protein
MDETKDYKNCLRHKLHAREVTPRRLLSIALRELATGNIFLRPQLLFVHVYCLLDRRSLDGYCAVLSTNSSVFAILHNKNQVSVHWHTIFCIFSILHYTLNSIVQY